MSTLTRRQIDILKHKRLNLRQPLAIICTFLLAPLLILLAVYLTVFFILPWIIAFVWLSFEVFYKKVTDNCVQVSKFNYPRIHDLKKEMLNFLDLRKDVDIFVYGDSSFNSFMIGLFHRRAIFLNSEILESGVEDDEVRWIIGRFIGYWRMKQDAGFLGWLISVTEKSGIFTLFVLPYTRAMVYTGDRLGLAAIDGNIEAALSAIQKLLVGRSLGYSVNPLGLIDQRRSTKGSLLALFARATSPFPSTISRYVDLLAFSKRAFPQNFASFEAGCPGLPDDIETLSAESPSPDFLGKLVGFILAIVAGLVLTVLISLAWGYVFNSGAAYEAAAEDDIGEIEYGEDAEAAAAEETAEDAAAAAEEEEWAADAMAEDPMPSDSYPE